MEELRFEREASETDQLRLQLRRERSARRAAEESLEEAKRERDNAVEMCSKYDLADPDNDGVAVITVSHGDGCEHFWGNMHARIANAIQASAMIS